MNEIKNNKLNKKPNFIMRFLHYLASPKNFYFYSRKLIPIFGLLALLCITVGTYWGLFVAPMDYRQGDAFRIIYIHVPFAILSQGIYVMMTTAYIVGWVWKIRLSDIFAQKSIDLGMIMTALALFTGAVWGKPIWGVYWVWDARITSTFIFLLIYIGIYLLQKSITNKEYATRISAILSIVGLVNIPIIKYSVDWWFTLHQGATFTVTKAPSMPSDMWLPLLINLIGFYCLYLYIALVRTKSQIIYYWQKKQELKSTS